MTTPSKSFIIRPEHPSDTGPIEALAAEAFGPGRFAKTAYRLREGAEAIEPLCLVAELDGELIGSIRLSAIMIGDSPALLLGPLVVRPAEKGRGYGIALMQTALDRARELGHRLVILVGDLPYYSRVGFGHVPFGRVKLPGPVDPRRLLYLELAEGAFDGVSGEARAASLAPLAEPGPREGGEQQEKPENSAHDRKRMNAV
ncbi:GNAT family N-acetyltransferase [Lutibaculum baratangense]|uniref:GNAT family N-acetyltransferase n=1 Tax=Lutibaculum baratangense TaxID=1358440 RepID=UPI0009E011B1|nr:N-acetyltransferase [Lutibaculum baratangense]